MISCVLLYLFSPVFIVNYYNSNKDFGDYIISFTFIAENKHFNMKYILILVATIMSVSLFAQDTTRPIKPVNKANNTATKPAEVVVDSPAYKKNPHIPSFSLLLTDSTTHYTNLDIVKGKPTVIVYFSPDCSHCQADAKNIAEKLDSLKDINFIWCSSHEVTKIKEFAIKYNMNTLPNMVFGKDEKWAIPSVYKIGFTPYFVVYGKDGLFYKEFRNGLLPKELMEAVEESNKKKKK